MERRKLGLRFRAALELLALVGYGVAVRALDSYQLLPTRLNSRFGADHGLKNQGFLRVVQLNDFELHAGRYSAQRIALIIIIRVRMRKDLFRMKNIFHLNTRGPSAQPQKAVLRHVTRLMLYPRYLLSYRRKKFFRALPPSSRSLSLSRSQRIGR